MCKDLDEEEEWRKASVKEISIPNLSNEEIDNTRETFLFFSQFRVDGLKSRIIQDIRPKSSAQSSRTSKNSSSIEEGSGPRDLKETIRRHALRKTFLMTKKSSSNSKKNSKNGRSSEEVIEDSFIWLEEYSNKNDSLMKRTAYFKTDHLVKVITMFIEY